MNEPFSFGAPERRRFAMQFGYDMRPSFWQGVRSNSHLVIAAVGTAALLGVAGIALWLALPANERQAVAEPAADRSNHSVKTTKIAPVTRRNSCRGSGAASRAQGRCGFADGGCCGAAAIPALAANDPRWTAPQSNTDPAATPSDQAGG